MKITSLIHHIKLSHSATLIRTYFTPPIFTAVYACWCFHPAQRIGPLLYGTEPKPFETSVGA